jgi:hypothetical protein
MDEALNENPVLAGCFVLRRILPHAGLPGEILTVAHGK